MFKTNTPTFSPGDAGLVCVTGFGLFKMLRLLEKDESFRPLPTNLRREACALAGATRSQEP
jgi:hypothetical protein